MKHVKLGAFLLLIGWLIPIFSPAKLYTAPIDGELIARSALRKIEPQVLKNLHGSKDGRVSVIVQFASRPDLSASVRAQDKLSRRRETVKALKSVSEGGQKSALDDLEKRRQNGSVESYTSLWIINGVAVKGDRKSVFALASRPDVEVIRADKRRFLPLPGDPVAPAAEVPGQGQETLAGVEWNIAKIRADAVWSALGIDGTGVVVASLDTGVDWQHPALMTKYRGYTGKGVTNHNGNWQDFTTPGAFQYPTDVNGHGTHVTGIMVGSDLANQVGVAPGAKWIAARVFTGSSSPYADDSWIHSAFQWILAPAGDPDLAPDIVNASWGSSDGLDQAFAADIEALLAAGIAPVFAAGNSGSASGTVNSPASLDAAFAVGATDSSDGIAYFSSRGPSPWGRIKPEASAPGVRVRSSYPGGSYVYMSGTSMATPHVAGLLALLKQADPELSPLEAFEVITSTAVPRGTGRPNNDYGWGRVDAYTAVGQAIQAGPLSGIVTSSSGSPIAGAIVTATNQASGAISTVRTAADGAYNMMLSVGFYDVQAAAFGYAASAVFREAIDPRVVATRDFALAPLPSGFIVGFVTEAGTGLPLTATVTALDTPLGVETDPSTGFFSMTVPTGVYTLKATSEKHRVRTESGVVANVSSTTTVTLALARAPSILLVDGGAWYYESKIDYYRTALDQLDYLYMVRPITDTGLVPTAAELSAYEVVIWSSPLDSPGYIGADAALVAYLDGGGRLLLSGQDVGYYDGGGSALFFAPYFKDRLGARLISDNAGKSDLVGDAKSIFAGITLTLNTIDSAQNQDYPDVVAPDGASANGVISYTGDGGAGIETGICLPYRVVYLGFGLEGAGPEANRAVLLDRALNWLASLPPSREVRVLPISQQQIQEPGKVATSTITVWNTGSLTETFAISMSGNLWPATLWDQWFTNPLAATSDIPSCQRITVGVKTEVPLGTGKNAYSSGAVSAYSISDPTVRQTATVTTKTPAFILVVDDDRWYEVESHYKNALLNAGYAYDVYDTKGGSGPDLSTLGKYSVTVWFTGYDWYQPLTAEDETSLSSYLDGGGKLFLSSQDYLYVRGLNEFGVSYLGILSYTNDLTATRITGEAGNIVGDGFGPFTLTLSYNGYKEWSDEVFPADLASESFLNVFAAPAGLTNLDGAGRGQTVFFAFPFEGLEAEPAKQVMDRIIGSALATDFRSDRRIAKAGDELRYEVSIFNPGNVTTSWVITSPVVANAAFIGESLEGGATYDGGGNQVLWQGTLASGDTKQLAYRVRMLPGAGGPIRSVTLFQRDGMAPFERQMTTQYMPFAVYLPVVQSGISGP